MPKPTSDREKIRSPGDARPAPAKGAKPAGPLAEARALLARGDVNAARARLQALLAGSTSDADQELRREARGLQAQIGVDPGALGTAALVLLVIAFAVLSAIFLRR